MGAHGDDGGRELGTHFLLEVWMLLGSDRGGETLVFKTGDALIEPVVNDADTILSRDIYLGRDAFYGRAHVTNQLFTTRFLVPLIRIIASKRGFHVHPYRDLNVRIFYSHYRTTPSSIIAATAVSIKA